METNHVHSDHSAPAQTLPPPRLRAGLILLLGLLPLTVGAARWLGLNELLGNTVAPLLLVLLVTAVWVGVVGWGRLPRPVATLTLAGTAAGVYIAVLQPLVLLVGDLGPAALLAGSVVIVAVQTLWGFVAGLLALAVQRLRER